MTIKTCKTAVRASAVLAAIVMSGGAFADEGISESFEGKTVGETLTTSTISGLTGNGTYASGGAATAPAAGFPIPGASGHATALEIAGTVTYAEGSAPAQTGASQVDFMFKVEATDELENPTGDDIRVALAVGTNAANTTTAPIKLWCKTTSGGSADWVDLAPAVTTGSWVRATLVLDYSNNKCSVSLNGDPALNDGDKWFYFANNGGSYVASITMVGSTMVDDLLVTHTALNSYNIPGGNTAVPGVPAGSPVTYADLNKYGVTVADAVADNDVSGCGAGKISEKITAGLDPKSATKFEMQTMTSTSATAATITFPGNKGASGYEVTATADKAGTGTVLDTATITPGAANEAGETVNSAAFSKLPDNDLIYFHLKTK